MGAQPTTTPRLSPTDRLKRRVKTLGLRVLSASGATRLVARRYGGRGVILMFHHFTTQNTTSAKASRMPETLMPALRRCARACMRRRCAPGALPLPRLRLWDPGAVSSRQMGQERANWAPSSTWFWPPAMRCEKCAARRVLVPRSGSRGGEHFCCFRDRCGARRAAVCGLSQRCGVREATAACAASTVPRARRGRLPNRMPQIDAAAALPEVNPIGPITPLYNSQSNPLSKLPFATHIPRCR